MATLKTWRRRAAWLTVSSVMLLATTAFAANGMRETGSSVRDISRGGAFIAVEPTAASLGGNPAALAFIDEAQLEIDLRAFIATVEYDGALNGRGSERMQLVPNLSYAERNGRFAWGLGVLSLSNMEFEVSDFDLSVVGAPPGTRDSASSKVRLLAISPGLAYQLDDCTSVGLTLHWSSGETADQAYDIFGNTSGQRLAGLAGSGYSLRAGLYHRADENTTLGAYWRSRSDIEVSNGTLTLAPGNPQGGGMQFQDVTVDGAEFPEEYGVGVAHRFSCDFRGIAEYRRILWSAVRKDIVITPPGAPPVVFPQNWVDQDVYVLGAEFFPDGDEDTVWRAGVNYAKSPVPDASLSPIFAATNELHYSLGFEQQLDDQLRIIIGGNYSPANQQTSSAANPYNATFGAGQPFSAGASLLNLGVGLNWKLGGRKHECCTCEHCSPCSDAAMEGEDAANALGTEQDAVSTDADVLAVADDEASAVDDPGLASATDAPLADASMATAADENVDAADGSASG